VSIKYRHVKLRPPCYDEIGQIRQELAKKGLKILPKAVLPDKPEKAFEIMGVIEIAVKLLSLYLSGQELRKSG